MEGCQVINALGEVAVSNVVRIVEKESDEQEQNHRNRTEKCISIFLKWGNF
jgi:hypothetical protein